MLEAGQLFWLEEEAARCSPWNFDRVFVMISGGGVVLCGMEVKVDLTVLSAERRRETLVGIKAQGYWVLSF